MSNQSIQRVSRVAEVVAAPQKPARSGNKDLQRIHRLLRGRYKWACLLAFCLASTGAYLGYRLGHQTYQSTGVIRIMPVVDPNIYKDS
jgi:uncharacterized protein involved in exopolysaccharide biosynthesis